jgi:GrpB-like predicted nucleotidyltransferase (UPF0157 family)
MPIGVLHRERERIRPLVPGHFELTGGSSLPGALTGGDIDLHLRVAPKAFAAAVEVLDDVYHVVNPGIWTDTLATFVTREPDEDVGIAVTSIGSEHDRRFRSAWARLRRDPSMLAAYNALKAMHAGSDKAAYSASKAAFFDRLAAVTTDCRRTS